jgi:hypothetical protein
MFATFDNGENLGHNMKIPVGSAGSLHRRSGTIPPAYPTRVRRTLLTAFMGLTPLRALFAYGKINMLFMIYYSSAK